MQNENKLHETNTKGSKPRSKEIPVTFALEIAEAREVYLCGDFNDWSPTAVRMIRREGNGRWEKRLTLPVGRYQYKFIVDGEWTLDPNARGAVINGFGSTNSVVEVGV